MYAALREFSRFLLPYIIPAVTASRSTEGNNEEGEGETQYYMTFLWTVLLLGILVGSIGYYHFTKFIQRCPEKRRHFDAQFRRHDGIYSTHGHCTIFF